MTATLSKTGIISFDGRGVSVNHPTYLSQHDLVYLQPPTLPEQAMPIGDGDLAAMLWCPGGDIRLQVNKSDLWWENPYTNKQKAADWQLLSAGAVSIRGASKAISAPQRFEQRLNLYSGSISIDAAAADSTCQITAFANSSNNVIVLNYRDSALRSEDRIIEVSQFRAGHGFAVGDYIGVLEALPDRRFALICRVIGQNAKSGWRDSRTPQMVVESQRGANFTVLITVAVTSSDRDPVSVAKARIEAAIRTGADKLLDDHKVYWRAFWQKSFLHLESQDNTANHAENLWYLNLYQMASCSRSNYAAKSNGSLWLSHRDARNGGGGYRHTPTQMLYWPLFASNHLELATPFFDTYQRALATVERQTREMLNAAGARFPEVMTRSGEDITNQDDPQARYHFACGLETAMLYWWVWKYTGDRDFLRARAYPMIRSCTEFYLSSIMRSPDGSVIVSPAPSYGSEESTENAHDDIAAVRFGLSACMEMSDELMEDEDERANWQTLLNSLPAYPKRAGLMPGTEIWGAEDSNWRPTMGLRKELSPVFPSGDVGIGSEEYMTAVHTLYECMRFQESGPWSIDAIVAARLGMREEIADLLSDYMRNYQTFPQGFCSHKTVPGADAVDRTPQIEPLGLLSTAVNEMCVQGHDGLIRVFPALPKDWNGSFMLRTEGGFIVMAEAKQGEVHWISIQSMTGQRCRLQNPWGDSARVLEGKWELLATDGEVLEFDTERGATYVIEPLARPISKMLRTRLSANRNKGIKQLGDRYLGLNAPPKEQ